jgi:mono/diheme cytochrome c family protein
MRSWRHFQSRTVRATVLGSCALLLGMLVLPEWSWWETPAAAGQAKKPAEPAGKLYQMRCAKCHGADGKGTEARPNLPKIPDFTVAAWQQSRTDAQLTASILEGKGVSMPAFGDRLDKGEARELVGHVRGFGPPPAGAKAGGRDIDQRIQALMDEFDRLRKEFYDLHGSRTDTSPARFFAPPGNADASPRRVRALAADSPGS